MPLGSSLPLASFVTGGAGGAVGKFVAGSPQPTRPVVERSTTKIMKRASMGALTFFIQYHQQLDRPNDRPIGA